MHPQIFDMVDEKSREKCLKEIRLVQSLTHDNIIKYIDAFIENHELMLIFEYAEVRVHCICMHAACGGTHKRLDCVGGVRERALDVRVVSVVTRPPPFPAPPHQAGDLKRQLRKALEKEARFDERVIWKYFSQIAGGELRPPGSALLSSCCTVL